MTIKEMYSQIASMFEGATMVRTGKANFLAIPTGDEEQPYIKVAVSKLLAKDTENNKAFNFEVAKAEYDSYLTELNIKANAPKKGKEKTVNAEAQAHRDAMDSALTDFLANVASDEEFTATQFHDLVPSFANETVMAVGSCAHRLVDMGLLVARKEKTKNYYTKA